MQVVRRVHQMREISREMRAKGRKIAFVPTMGALHDGHLALVRAAREFGGVVVVSIFVNPTQFGPAEDFEAYPRDLARDADLCIQEGVDYLFCPEAHDVYGEGFRTYVEVEGLGTVLEGASRPGFFRGVCTVVLKLFNIVRPHRVFFGQKDAQQALIVRRMIRDLNVDTEMIVVPTVRHEDGLAMSSRNAYLDSEERSDAAALFRSLDRARQLVEDGGERDARRVEQAVREILAESGRVRVDYVAVVDAETLVPSETVAEECLVAVAAWVGETRLIDNVLLHAKQPVA